MPPRSQLLLSHILGEVTSPCQNQCFMNDKTKEVRLLSCCLQCTYTASVSRQASLWDEADVDMFRVISEISPNATSCDLAELCLKPCHEVILFIQALHKN